jgi:hypothetical protein
MSLGASAIYSPSLRLSPSSNRLLLDVRVRARARAWAMALAMSAAACHGDTLGTSSGTTYTIQTVDQQPHNAVDLLFVVSDTKGATPKQQALVAGFPALLRALRAAPGGLPDLRIGVVSSNMGAFGSRLAECDHSDRALLTSAAPGCAAAPRGRVAISLDGGSRSNFAAGFDLADAFACLVRGLGNDGCGFEQPLAAARRALDADQPIENEGFLRPDALLALVIVSDADDCSAPATTDLFEPSTARYGPQGTFRCNQYGHLCAGSPPPREATSLGDCVSAEGTGKLTPIGDVAGFFRALVSPERLLVSVLAGPPSPYAIRVADGEPEAAPSCESATGAAGPGVRLKQFADAFGGRGTFASVCDPDLSGALGRLGDGIVQQVGASCLGAAPVRLGAEADTDKGKPDCWVNEQAAGLGREVPLPRCDGGTARPCWSVVPSREHCESSGYELHIDRGDTAPLPGTVDTLHCRVCTRAGDPRCP